MNNWISVKDRLPDVYTEVLFYNPEENLYIHGYFEDISNSWHEVGGNKVELNVTHWMPLPEPPTGKDELTLMDNNVMMWTDGVNFICSCGGNVFTKYKTSNNKIIYECHSCNTHYEGE